MLAILETSREGEAEILGRWAVRHPSMRTKEVYRKLTTGDYAEASTYSFILARMADQQVFDWAKNYASIDEKKRWVCFYVIAQSPLPEARAETEKIANGNEIAPLISLVQAFDKSEVPWKFDRLRQIANRPNNPRKLNFWLGRTLGNLAYRGDPVAAELLKTIPVANSEEPE
jgi:hypothetical protein